MRKIKSIVSLMLITAVILTCFINTYAENSDKLVMELKVGSNIGKAYGTSTKIEKPYTVNNTVMVPLSWFTTSIGAEIKWTNNKIQIIYNDSTIELQIGKTTYTADSKTKKLSVAPTVRNSRTMVPLEFISDNFPVTVSRDKKSGEIKITLEDDGALSDLSFLTGGITTPAVGNSYYGWSVNIPTGSRIITNTVKSDYIGITNESRNLYFEISVEEKNDLTLSELYKTLMYSGDIRSSDLKADASQPYFEYTGLSDYDEAVRVKVFEKGKYFYYFTLSSYDSAVTPEKLSKDKYCTNIINSFSLSYKGNVKGIQDLSKIKQGKYSFYNYIMFSEDAKYLPWAMEIPVEWDQLMISSDPLTTELGSDSKHYMKIMLSKLEDNSTLEDYFSDINDRYKNYFNPQKYEMISSDMTTIAGNEAYGLQFSITLGSEKYLCQEYYFESKGFVYEITIKLPEKEFTKGLDKFLKILNSIRCYDLNMSDFTSEYVKYESKYEGIRLSNSDDLFEYENSDDGWSLKIPGYWTRPSSSSYTVSFENPYTNANILVDSVILDEYTQDLTDDEKFYLIGALAESYDLQPVKSEYMSENGYSTREYKYRVEDEEIELYANITFKCFDSNGYSYCFATIIPDLTATDEALKEIEGIWKSFKLIDIKI